jgi:hypothetical protein
MHAHPPSETHRRREIYKPARQLAKAIRPPLKPLPTGHMTRNCEIYHVVKFYSRPRQAPPGRFEKSADC